MAEHHGLSNADHPVQVGESLELLLLIVTLDKELGEGRGEEGGERKRGGGRREEERREGGERKRGGREERGREEGGRREGERREGGERKRGGREERGREEGGEREERGEERGRREEGELVQNTDSLTQSLTQYLLNVVQTLLTSFQPNDDGVWNDSLCKPHDLITVCS